jgi:hypothetical protein
MAGLADAIVLELMSIASGLELRRRNRTRASTGFPATVLSCAVTLSLAAQVAEAEPSPIGWIAAAVPALGFLVMVKVALGYTGTATRTSATRPSAKCPDRTVPITHEAGPTEASQSTGPAGERSTTRTTHPSTAAHQLERPDRRTTSDRGRSTPPSADVDELLPAARLVRDQLATDGRALTRGALAEALRAAGHTVSNTRVSQLLKTLKAESPSAPAPHHGDRPTAVANLARSPQPSPQHAADTAGPADQLPALPISSTATRHLDPQTPMAQLGEPRS